MRPDTTFGRVIKLMEEAESHRAKARRLADGFSAYYLLIVAGVASLTFLLRRDSLATAAMLVVACSCALAAPIAMLASIGAGVRRGLLIKGGNYLETLAQADVGMPIGAVGSDIAIEAAHITLMGDDWGTGSAGFSHRPPHHAGGQVEPGIHCHL